jgi:hypothetical protein
MKRQIIIEKTYQEAAQIARKLDLDAIKTSRDEATRELSGMIWFVVGCFITISVYFCLTFLLDIGVAHAKNLKDVDEFHLPSDLNTKWAFLFALRQTTSRAEWLLVTKKFLLGVDYIRLGNEMEETRARRDLLNIAITLKEEQAARPALKRVNSLDAVAEGSQSQSQSQ